jgi:hypothetical protein
LALEVDSQLVLGVDGRPAGFAATERLEERQHVRATLGLSPTSAAAAAAQLLAWVERRAEVIAAQNHWTTTTAVTWLFPGALAVPVLLDRGWTAEWRRNTPMPALPPS